MRFACRIGWHDWVYGKPYVRTVQYVDDRDRPTYSETYRMQRKACKRCFRTREIRL